jgi:hypothetical protein
MEFEGYCVKCRESGSDYSLRSLRLLRLWGEMWLTTTDSASLSLAAVL